MKIITFNNLNLSFYPSSVGFQDKTILFLPGIPSKPREYEAVAKFNSLGYDVFIPEYEGTWNSSGIFLDRHPAYSIDQLISKISEGLRFNEFNYTSKNIYILGSSFGGWVALALENRPEIKKVCLLSPVIKFKNVNGISTLASYLKEQFANEYRFVDKNWTALINDEMLIQRKDLQDLTHKIMIIAGELDDQINAHEIEKFSKCNNINNYYVDKVGHITFSKITNSQFDRIVKFFSDVF